jgi:hypothetical protein
LNKTKQNKKKVSKNILKIKYLLKKSEKNNDSILNKTTICNRTPNNFISCISTPSQKIGNKRMLESFDY